MEVSVWVEDHEDEGLRARRGVFPWQPLVLLAACLVWWQWAGGSWAPALTLAGAAVLAGGAVCVAWAKFGRKAVPAFTLLTAPLYIAWKLPIYLRLVARREKTWVRTDRGRLSDSGLA